MKKKILKNIGVAIFSFMIINMLPNNIIKVNSAVYTDTPTLGVSLYPSTVVNGSYSQKHDLRMGTWTYNSKYGSGATGIFLDGVSVGSTSRGLSMVAWDSNFNVIKNVNYDTYGNAALGDNLANDIDALPQGSLVAIQSFDAYNVSSNLRSSLYRLGVPNAYTMNTDADPGVDCGNSRVTFQYACYKGSPCVPLLYYYDRNGYTYVDNAITVGSSNEYIVVNSSNSEGITLPGNVKLFSNSLGADALPIFRFYVYSNGVKDFKATNSSGRISTNSINVTNIDTTGPTIYDSKVFNQDENGYDVDIWVKDDQSGIYTVRFPTWTDYNGQDDIGDWANTTNGTIISTVNGIQQWRFHVNKSSHDNEMGWYSTHIYAYDNFGYYSFVPLSINLVPNRDATLTDNIPATMEAGQTYPVTVTVTNTGNTPWTSATNFKLGGHEFDWNSGNWQRKLIADGVTVSKGQSYDFKFNIVAPTTPGTYTGGKFKMVQENVAWFGSELNKTIKVVDTTKPSGVISPNGSTWRNKGIDISIMSTDSGSGVASQNWYYSDDGELTWKLGATGSTVTNWWDTWNKTTRAKIVITDNSGNSNEILTNYFNIDSTSPIIGSANNPEIRYTNASSGTMRFQVNNVTDNLSGVAGADFFAGIDNGTIVDAWTYSMQAGYQSGTNWYWDLPLTVAEGRYRVRTHTYDNAGNGEIGLRGLKDNGWSTPVDQFVIVDRTVPTITLTQDTPNWTNLTVKINVIASDNGSGVKSITLPNGEIIYGNSTMYSVNKNETYNFMVTDNSGNTTTKSIVVSSLDEVSLTLSDNTVIFNNENSPTINSTISVKSTNPYDVDIIPTSNFINTTDLTTNQVPITKLSATIDTETSYSQFEAVNIPKKLISGVAGTIGLVNDTRFHTIKFRLDPIIGYKAGIYEIPLIISVTSK